MSRSASVMDQSCGAFTCGVPSPLDCVADACDCGATRNYVSGVGCVEDRDCTDCSR
ncbi:MAG: hypothetical protein IPK60_15830 [Sandaracinaceae bacterium]|nr:hypothetical protein [Sandaracinaceae bacterium]